MSADRNADPLLEIRNLSVTFAGRGGTKPVEAVKGVSLTLDRGETLALVGESGSGKSVTALSILQLLPYPVAAHSARSSIRFAGEELVGAAPERLRRVRGNRIAMVFQEPMTSLNPLHTLERQIAETLFIHRHMSAGRARERTLELLRLVGLPDAEHRLAAYPHQFSGDQNVGLVGDRHRDHHPLALAARELVRIGTEPALGVGQIDQPQEFEDPLARRCGSHVLVDEKRLPDLPLECVQRVERGHWLLKDHRNAIATHLAQLLRRGADQLLAGKTNAALRAVGCERVRQQLEDR